jgi:hypothetical protein
MSSNGSNPNQVGLQNEANRVAWVEAALKKVPAGSRILDAGAGEQRFREACGHLKYVSQDVAQYDGKGDSHGLQTGGWDFSKFGKPTVEAFAAGLRRALADRPRWPQMWQAARRHALQHFRIERQACFYIRTVEEVLRERRRQMQKFPLLFGR